MSGMWVVVVVVLLLLGLLFVLHWFSYFYLKGRIIGSRSWDLNICCGRTDGGGVNVDIVEFGSINNFWEVADVCDLPFGDKEFEWVLSSHTVEHLDEPAAFDRELQRVGRHVVYIVPPLWDVAAVLNVLEHKWVFLTFRKKHDRLPRHVRLPGARMVQRWLGQRIKA